MISITSETIDICKILLDTMDNWAGGTVLFTGSVRDHNEDGTVSEIYYEAYKEMAEKNLTEIEIEARTKWNVKKFVAVHRVGNLKVGEVAVAVAASAEHRKEAFEACRYGIDEIKIRVPIWKKEVTDSGIGWVEGVSSKSE
jgi:molybdopterin synthase catalytic subunit